MGSAQHFCLRWNHHLPNFTSAFYDLLLNNSLVDVTLAADGRHLQAHKLVLSACSPYFQELFTVNPNNHPIVILKDICFDHLRIIVEFMYKGEVNISKEELDVLLQAAGTLQVKGLSEISGNTHKSHKLFDHEDNNVGNSGLATKPDGVDFAHSGKRRKTARVSNNVSEECDASDGEVRSIDAAYDQLDISSLFMVKSENEPGCGQFSGNASNSQSGPIEAKVDHDEQPEPGPSDENANSQGYPTQMGDTSDSMSRIPEMLNHCKGSSFQPVFPKVFESMNLSGYSSEFDIIRALSNSYNKRHSATLRKVRYKPSPEALSMAIEAVRSGKMGFHAAAKTYGLSTMTLHGHYRKLGYPVINKFPGLRCGGKKAEKSETNTILPTP